MACKAQNIDMYIHIQTYVHIYFSTASCHSSPKLNYSELVHQCAVGFFVCGTKHILELLLKKGANGKRKIKLKKTIYKSSEMAQVAFFYFFFCGCGSKMNCCCGKFAERFSIATQNYFTYVQLSLANGAKLLLADCVCVCVCENVVCYLAEAVRRIY